MVRINEKPIVRVGGPVWKSPHGLAAFTRAVDLLGALALGQGENSMGRSDAEFIVDVFGGFLDTHAGLLDEIEGRK